jgi:hypothetical protein
LSGPLGVINSIDRAAQTAVTRDAIDILFRLFAHHYAMSP